MKLNVKMILNLQPEKVISLAEKATRLGLRDTVVAIARDVVHESPVITGHNRRSIAYKVESKKTSMGNPKAGEKPFSDEEPNTGNLQGAIYSTSGYGGFLETGTGRMAAQPYFKPALDRNIGNLPGNIKKHFDAL